MQILKGEAQIDQIGYLNVVPNSNPLGIKWFVPSFSMSLKCECYVINNANAIHTKS